MVSRPVVRKNRVRVSLTPSGGDEADTVSVWGTTGKDGAVTLDTDVPGVAAGWAVAWRGFAGAVEKADGRTLTVGGES